MTQPSPEQITEHIIRLGRACVRMIETAASERRRLRLVKALYQDRLRDLVQDLPPEVSAEIFAASEKMTGQVKGFTNI